MEIVKSIVLGIVQGLTEFLPVSSSGHLVIVPFLFKWDYIPVYYSVTLHFATLLSLLTVFYRDIWKIIKAFFVGLFKKGKRSGKYFRFSIFIIIATVPAALVGFFLKDYIEAFFSSPLYVGILLLVTAVFLMAGEFIGSRVERKLNKNVSISDNIEYKGLNYVSAAVVGIGQAVAIFPGISRSGSTISFTRLFGIKREECVRFSMLLSIPVISGAFIFEISKTYRDMFQKDLNMMINIAVSFVFSYLSGLLAIKFLLVLSRNKNLNFFAVYCIVVGIIIIVLSAMRKF